MFFSKEKEPVVVGGGMNLGAKTPIPKHTHPVMGNTPRLSRLAQTSLIQPSREG